MENSDGAGGFHMGVFSPTLPWLVDCLLGWSSTGGRGRARVIRLGLGAPGSWCPGPVGPTGGPGVFVGKYNHKKRSQCITPRVCDATVLLQVILTLIIS